MIKPLTFEDAEVAVAVYPDELDALVTKLLREATTVTDLINLEAGLELILTKVVAVTLMSQYPCDVTTQQAEACRMAGDIYNDLHQHLHQVIGNAAAEKVMGHE